MADLADRLRTEDLDDRGLASELINSVVRGTIALLDDAELAVFSASR